MILPELVCFCLIMPTASHTDRDRNSSMHSDTSLVTFDKSVTHLSQPHMHWSGYHGVVRHFLTAYVNPTDPIPPPIYPLQWCSPQLLLRSPPSSAKAQIMMTAMQFRTPWV